MAPAAESSCLPLTTTLSPIVELADLSLFVNTDGGGSRCLLANASLRVGCGEIVGLVGRSGSGKTTIARAILDILPRTVKRDGRIRINAGASSRTHCPVAYIDQDPGATLNPVRRIGGQVVEVLRRNRGLDARAGEQLARELLAQLSLPQRVFAAYPHEVSGGQQQRVAIARAIACDPALVIADEPGSALDVVTQLEVIDALLAWRREMGFAVLLISHESHLIHNLCDRVVRLEGASLIEQRQPATERCA